MKNGDTDAGFFKLMTTLKIVNQAKNSPEELDKLFLQAVETRDDHLFDAVCNAMQQKEPPITQKEIWKKLIETGDIDFLKEKALCADTIESVNALQQALFDYSLQQKEKSTYLPELRHIVRAARSSILARNIKTGNHAGTIFINSDALKGDFPDIIINTEDVAFRFCGLKKEQITKKGMSLYLKELFTDYEKQYLIREEDFKKEATKTNPNEELLDDESILSSAESVYFYYNSQKPSDLIGDIEFQKADKLSSLCFEFLQTPAAPLFDLLIQENKALSFNKVGFSQLKGISLSNAITVDNIKEMSTLHHELVHNADRELHFTQTPVFQALSDYCVSNAMCSPVMKGRKRAFWKEMNARYVSYRENNFPVETPAFLASLSYQTFSEEVHVENVLNFINAYVKAHIDGNEKEESRLTRALQNTTSIEAQHEPIQYLGQILQPQFPQKTLIKGPIVGRD